MKVTEIISNTIKETLEEYGLEAKKIMLFGSRARGTNQIDSDWDLMILIDKELSFQDRKIITTQLKRKFAKMRIPNDIIIKSVNSYEKLKKHPGHIAYYLYHES